MHDVSLLGDSTSNDLKKIARVISLRVKIDAKGALDASKEEKI